MDVYSFQPTGTLLHAAAWDLIFRKASLGLGCSESSSRGGVKSADLQPDF